MPPFAIGPTGSVNATRPVAGGTSQRAEPRTDGDFRTASAHRPASAGANRDLLDPGPEPIDAERIAHIRKAIESGTYPLIPAAVADAFIAAGFMLRNPR